MSEKSRDEFEAWFSKTCPLTNRESTIGEVLCKAIAGEAWKASRESLVVGWQPMETCPKHVDVLFFREDCGVINGQFTCADSFMTDKERDSGDYSEEEQFSEDAWCYGPQGVERLDGDLVPTHWMPYPGEPEVAP